MTWGMIWHVMFANFSKCWSNVQWPHSSNPVYSAKREICFLNVMFMSHIQCQSATSNFLTGMSRTGIWSAREWGDAKLGAVLKLESLLPCASGRASGKPALMGGGASAAASASFEVARVQLMEKIWRTSWYGTVQHQLLNRLFQDGPTLIQDRQLVWDNWFFISRCCFFFPCFICDAAVPSREGL